MKKKLYALSGVFLIVLVIAGLWAAKAVSLTGVEQTIASPQKTSTAAELSLQEMTTGALVIVTGTCLQTKSQWVGRSLFTMATVAVTDSIKGDAPSTLVVALPGGADSNRKFPIAMTYAGAPQMHPTEEMFLFLKAGGAAGNYSVMGFAQGKFSIAKTNAGEPVVARDMTMAPLQKGVGVTRGNRQVLSLSEFKARVKSYLNK
jgi:hypothetical protein